MISIQQKAEFRHRVIKYVKDNHTITEASNKYRITRQTIHRWILRYDGTVESLKEKSRRPHKHPREHTDEEKRMVMRVATQNKKLGLVCLWIHLKQKHNYTRTIQGLYKLLIREGIITVSKKRKRYKSKPYEPILFPGERFQVDVKYVPKECLTGNLAGKRYYQYTAIDECTRWRYMAIYDEHSAWNSAHFASSLLKKFPFEIQCIQTDNGCEFTSILQGAKHPSAFEAYLESNGIRHKRIAPATPRHNGKVERSHRTDQERFYNGNKFYSLKYLNEQLRLYMKRSNNAPLLVHNWRSASQYLNSFIDLL
jgi:transposase